VAIQSGPYLQAAPRLRKKRWALPSFLTLLAILATQVPRWASAQDDTSIFTGGPLLAGATAGTPEGGSLAIAGALASADPSTGIAHSSYSFRLETARGRVQPSLGLTYSSADGQREAGIGWGLNIASIERHNVSGGPTYNDPPTGGAVTASTDRFEFGGSPLVPICDIDDAGRCKGALKGEVMPSWAKSGWNYFRLEVDDTYERFFWSPDHYTWRVQTKTGETREYGLPADGIGGVGGIDQGIRDLKIGNVPYETAGVFRWNLVRRYDAVNDANEIVYVWRQLSSSDGDLSPIGSLTDIYDTSPPGQPSYLPGFAHHTELMWEADPAAVPSNLQPQVFRVRPTFRLAQVNIWSFSWGFVMGIGVERGLVRSYALTYYKPGTQSVQYARSLLESIQMTGACPNLLDSGSHRKLTLSCATLPATKFTYNTATAAASWSTMSNMVAANSTFVDIDGDGYPDAVSAENLNGPEQNPRPHFARNIHGMGFAREAAIPLYHNPCTSGPSGANPCTSGPSGAEFAFGVVAGIDLFSFGNWGQVGGPGTDGFFDSSLANSGIPSGFYVAQMYRGALSLIDTDFGSEFNPPRHPWCFTGEFSQFNGVADLDGDGFPDCWSIPTWGNFTVPPRPYSGLTTQDANGLMNPFAMTEYPLKPGGNFNLLWYFGADYVPRGVPPTEWFRPLVVDITGDGIPDLVWLWATRELVSPWTIQGYISVIAGKGDGTFSNGFTVPMPHCGNEWPNTCEVALVDLNGDGFADFIAMDSLNTTIILSAGVTATGITWGQQFSLSPAPFPSTHSPAEQIYGPQFADLNASGVMDLLYVASYYKPTSNAPELTGFEPGTVSYIDLLGSEPPPLLETVSNGLGATTRLKYASTASLGFAAASSGHPWGTTSTQSVHVLTSIETEIIGNKAAGGPFITSYEYQGASTDEYAGAMYDKRFRRFNGFGFVRTKITSSESYGTYDVTDTYYEPSLSSATASTDVPWDALKGLAVFSTRYGSWGGGLPVSEPLSSSHTTYKISRLYKGIDGRIVRQVVPEIEDTWVYDGALMPQNSAAFGSLQDVDDVSDGAVSVSRTRTYQPLQWPSKHTRSSISVDDFGNVTAANDEGILGTDRAIARSWKWATADNDWNWCPTHTSVKYAGESTDRQYDFAYNSAGEVIKITGNLSGTLAIRQDVSLTPKHASPQHNPSFVLAMMKYDPQDGNLTAADAGGLRKASYQYDTTYQQFLTKVNVWLGGGKTFDLITSVVYDRGLEVPIRITNASSGLTKASYDIFGRITAVQLPDPSTPSIADIHSGVTVTYMDVPGGPYQRADIARNLGSIAVNNVLVPQVSKRTVFTDALGRVAAVLSSGGVQDPAGQWIVSGMSQRDARGSVSELYESFFAPLTNGSPGVAPPPVPAGTKSRSFLRDPFERVTESHDLNGELMALYVYHDFSRDTYDASDYARAAAVAPTYSTVLFDGHGRPIEWDQRTGNAGGDNGTSPDTLRTNVSYLATDEPTVLTRSSAKQGMLYTRWIQYDSLGRMVLNVEPNTSTGFVYEPVKPGSVPVGLKAWMYAYDAIGNLVGTLDARGCGINYTYDGAGRETSEDYIPCTSDQAPYTPVDSSSGAGAEVFNVYDTAEAGEPDTNSGGAAAAPFLRGKLVATYSRGEHTQFAYDGRGRVTSIARQMPNPPGATEFSFSPGTRRPAGTYAPSWYQTLISYDEGDRPIAQSTGAAVSGLQGSVVNVDGAASGGTSVVTTAYDARNIPTKVSGSYGVLAFGEQRDSDGRLLKLSYGDLAGTTAEYTYDSRRRLQTAKVARAFAPTLWGSSLPGYPTPSGQAFPTPTSSGQAFTTPLILQDLGFSYDAVNNPVLIRDLRTPAEWPPNAGPSSATLAYDDLYRVTSVALTFARSITAMPGSPMLNQIPPFTPSDLPPINFKMPTGRSQSQTFGYDSMGDVTTSTDDADALLQRSAGSATYGPIPGGVTGPNQLAQSQSANGYYVTAYDAAGNLTSIAANLPGVGSDTSRLILTLNYQWDEAGHLQRATRSQYNVVPGNTVFTQSTTTTNNYLYDGSGVRTWHSSDGTKSTQYYLDIFPSLRVSGTQWNFHGVPVSTSAGRQGSFFVWDYDVTNANEQVYLVSGDLSYGRLVRDGTLPSPSQRALHTFLEITDPHGSTNSVIDKETGELVEQITYLANGQTETDYRPRRWKQFREGYRYSGKKDDYEVGLAYYGARYFVSGIGRWASPDPLTIHALGSDLNPYSFVRGSPYRYVDPLGLGDNDNEVTQCDSQNQSCQTSSPICDQCTRVGDETGGYLPSPGPDASFSPPSGFGVFNGAARGGSALPHAPPPPTPQPISNLVSRSGQESSSQANTSFPGDIRTNGLNGCDSMHTENCEHDISVFVFPNVGAFLIFGKEMSVLGPNKVGLFGEVGYNNEDGLYLGVIGERGYKVGPVTVSQGFEKEIYSEGGFLSKPAESLLDVNLTLGPEGAPGIGVMAPLDSNIKTLATSIIGGEKGGYKFSPYVFFPLGPIEVGAGVEMQTTRKWGWGSIIDGGWKWQ